MSVSRIAKNLKGARKDYTAVVIGTVTDDNRFHDLTKMTVAALRFSETARARITKAGGKCLALDELIMANPKGTNTVLLRGPRMREAKRHFGKAPGVPGSRTKPYICSKGKKSGK